MKVLNFLVFALIAAIVLPAVVAATSKTQEDPPSAAQTKASVRRVPVKGPMSACPMCPAIGGAPKSMNMSPAMKQHFDMTMNAELTKHDATCLLALKRELKLTPEQDQQLGQILEESRQKAAALLTPKQQKVLVDGTAQPMSMIGLHMKMHEMTKVKNLGPTNLKNKATGRLKGAASHSR